MTITYPAPSGPSAVDGVYPPQQDSQLLVETMERTALVPGQRVLDLCTGSGFVAIAAAEMGAASVTAFDICPRAVRCSRGNAIDAGVDVDVREGSWTGALTCGPFDVIVSNPPYVPIAPEADSQLIPSSAGPEWSWNGGADGRLILDPLCAAASELLRDGGSMLLVQSAFADADRSLRMLRATGMEAEIIASRWIPFGPVLSAQAKWLENIGRLRTGCRKEKLVVIRADKP
ncbi:MAG TPA: HemK2/MTQ2 family protein methyltransferase [Mycobacterium sp.]|nr:HemK2/MTQ2 family protein methyltransferase [Mycobacterium sp.]